MERRILTVTVDPGWHSALRAAGQAAEAEHYQDEQLNFETPESFFGRLTARRWALVHTLQGAGPVSIRELARRAQRDVRRVHDDINVLTELGLLERTEHGGVLCPFVDIHVDMHLREAV